MNANGPSSSRRARALQLHNGGFTLVEGVVAMAVFGLLMAVVTTQLVESLTLSLKTSTGLEHARSTRTLIDQLGSDLRCSQRMVLHTSFTDREDAMRDGEYADYLVLHQIDPAGTINRTIGYYAVTDGDGIRTLYRHDSANSDSAAGELPAVGSSGTHRKISRAIQIPDSTLLFRCVGDRGISIRGQFGRADGNVRTQSQYIQCALTTRS